MSMPSDQSAGPRVGQNSSESSGESSGAFGPVFSGRYGDGQSATVSDVEVRLTETGLEITRTMPKELLFWP
ncbi:MAG: hypothetical protein ABL908_09840, partial [Hyphomicrobium sp.]